MASEIYMPPNQNFENFWILYHFICMPACHKYVLIHCALFKIWCQCLLFLFIRRLCQTTPSFRYAQIIFNHFQLGLYKYNFYMWLGKWKWTKWAHKIWPYFHKLHHHNLWCIYTTTLNFLPLINNLISNKLKLTEHKCTI